MRGVRLRMRVRKSTDCSYDRRGREHPDLDAGRGKVVVEAV